VSADQRPAETAAHQHAQDEAALAVSQMTGSQDGHSVAVMAPYPGVSVTDRTDPGVTGPTHPGLPPVPGSTNTGTPAA
jgi:hypothetical protein